MKLMLFKLWLRKTFPVHANKTCDICGKAATTHVGFVGKGGDTHLCKMDVKELCRQYSRMGKPGQIIIRPVTVPVLWRRFLGRLVSKYVSLSY